VAVAEEAAEKIKTPLRRKPILMLIRRDVFPANETSKRSRNRKGAVVPPSAIDAI
jgi:hypothetical protein